MVEWELSDNSLGIKDKKEYFEFNGACKEFQVLTAPGKKMLTISKLKQEGGKVFGNHIYIDLIPR